MYLVYKATNKNNGKIYIGMTGRGLRARVRSHILASKASNLRFHQAIRKHGIEAFAFEVLFESKDCSEVRREEARLIAEMDATSFSKGYNSRPGGSGGWIVPLDKYDSWASTLRELGFEKNPNATGVPDEQYLELAERWLRDRNASFVPRGGWSVAIGLPSMTNRTTRRFGGLGRDGFLQEVSRRTNLPIAPRHHKSEHHKNALSGANKRNRWITDGENTRVIKQNEPIPQGWRRGRTINGKS